MTVPSLLKKVGQFLTHLNIHYAMPQQIYSRVSTKRNESTFLQKDLSMSSDNTAGPQNISCNVVLLYCSREKKTINFLQGPVCVECERSPVCDGFLWVLWPPHAPDMYTQDEWCPSTVPEGVGGCEWPCHGRASCPGSGSGHP